MGFLVVPQARVHVTLAEEQQAPEMACVKTSVPCSSHQNRIGFMDVHSLFLLYSRF